MLAREVGLGRRHGFEFDEGSQPLDVIEVDAYAAPHVQKAALGHDDANADRRFERGAQRDPVMDDDESVAAFSLLGLVGALELDQVALAGCLLAELEAAVYDVEVRVALPDLAVILGVQRPADFQRTRRRGITSLELHVPTEKALAGCRCHDRDATKTRRRRNGVPASRDG
jgi:hypothetical protein